MFNPKISIIVPIYNSGLYLKESIDSILEQTYKNIEIILVDDGSTDNSLEICNNYSKENNNVKTYHLTNGRVSKARNFGIYKSSGEWITFVDSDDIISNDYCERLINSIDSNTDMVIGRTISFLNNNINNLLDDNYNGGECDEFITIEEKNVLFKSILVDNYRYIKYPHVSTCSAKLIKKSIIQNNHIKYNEQINLYEDAIFNMQIIYYSKKIRVINKKIYYYRTRNNSSSNTFKINVIEQYKNVYNEINKFEREKKINLSEYLDYFKIKNLNILLTNYYRNNNYNRNITKKVIDEYKNSLKNTNYNILPKKRKVLKLLSSIHFYYFIYLLYKKG